MVLLKASRKVKIAWDVCGVRRAGESWMCFADVDIGFKSQFKSYYILIEWSEKNFIQKNSNYHKN